ncbi:retrotransposon protein, putative, unclassified [Tanacetum coccineum]
MGYNFSISPSSSKCFAVFIVDSGCTKHMMRNLKLLFNFVEKYLGTVRFGNDQFAPNLGYGDLGNDLLTGNRGSDFYTIALEESSSPTLICFMEKASPTQAWLWHRRFSHLNFDTINMLSKNDIVNFLPKLKFEMSLIGEMKFFLGLQIHQSLRGIFINQFKYALKILKKHGMDKCDSFGTLMDTLPKLDADPSAEAEYVSLSARYAQVLWMRTQLKDYGFDYNKILLYCDSQSAIAISCNHVQHSRIKHINVHYHFIKEQVENGIVELYFVRTEYQLADMFTKAFSKERFEYLVGRLGMICLTPAELEVLTNESS